MTGTAAPATDPSPTPLDHARAEARDLLTNARLVSRPGGLEAPAARLRWFAAVDSAAKDAEAASKVLKALRDAARDDTIAALDALGLQRAPLTGGPTIYRARELWAGYAYPDDATPDEKAELKARANEALRDVGLGEYVQEGANAQSLSAYFRDLERDLEDRAREADGLPEGAPVAIDPADLLPEGLRDLVKLTEKVYPKAVAS